MDGHCFISTQSALTNVLLWVDGDEQIVPLPVQQEHHHFILFYLRRSLLVILQAFDYLMVDLLDHVTTLQPGGLGRAARLDGIDHHASGFRVDLPRNWVDTHDDANYWNHEE